MAKSEETLNVLFIGMPGAGKSSTINILVGRDVCEFGQTFRPCGITEELQFCQERIQTALELDLIEQNYYAVSKKADVIENIDNTTDPRLAVTNKTEERTDTRQTVDGENVFARRFVLVDSSNNLKDVSKRKNEFHLFAFICPFKRYTRDSQRFLEKISKSFNNFFERSVIIITQCAREQEQNFTKEINAVSRIDKKFRKLYKKAPLLFCSTDTESHQKFRRDFLDKLVDIVIQRFTPKGIRFFQCLT